MGDPRKQRKKYETPKHPWRMERIVEENELLRKYGLKNKSEIWRAKSTIGRVRKQARHLLGSSGEEIKKESKELLNKLDKLGIENVKALEDVLALTVDDILSRRLQTIVYNKGLANTPKQARQLIVHRHVMVEDRIVNVPSYLVPKDEEDKIRLKEGVKVIPSGRKEKREKEGSEG